MPVSFTTRSLSCVSDFDHGAGRRKNFLSADEENFLFLFLYLLAGKRK